MPSYFPCPNAQCSYQFDADILPPAAMVTCPLCRTRFPYRASRPVPAAAGPDAGPAPADEPRPSAGPRVVNLRDAPKNSVLPTILWVGGFCVVLALLVVGLTMRGRGPSRSGNDAQDEKFNVKLEPFPGAWEDDMSARKPTDANVIGRKRAEPEGWVAVSARDFLDRQPRTSELKEMMEGGLRQGFRTLELEPVEGEKWAGHDALGVRFTGLLDDTQVRGEAYAMSYKGVGYTFFAWAPEASWEAVRGEAVGLREKVKPAGFREGWKEKRVNTEVHTVEGAGYQVEDQDGVWIRAKPEDQWKKEDKDKYVLDDVKDEDEHATMAFRAEYRIRERGDSKRIAAETKALVVELPGAGDPLETAKAHVIERIKKAYAGGMAPDVKLEPMTRSPGGVALPTGGPAIGRFLFRDPFDPKNPEMYVISAINVGGKTVAVEAQTLERNASYVDEWMVHLAGSLKAR